MRAPIDVELTDAEVERARRVAHARNDRSIAAGLAPALDYAGDGFAIDFPGAAGELAFCKAAGLVWPETVDTFKLPDARWNLQIRTAPCKAARPPQGFGRLRVSPEDDGRDYYCLVVGNAPYFRVHGWIVGRAAQRMKWWDKPAPDRPAAFFVPAADLNPDYSEVLG